MPRCRVAFVSTGPLHHLELAAGDLEKALGFWRWLLGQLGFEPYEQWDGGESFLCGDFYVVLRQADNCASVGATLKARRRGLSR
jgi:catechol 2,3-dioxygenase-like lactoylglutathione lyase family enzyme